MFILYIMLARYYGGSAAAGQGNMRAAATRVATSLEAAGYGQAGPQYQDKTIKVPMVPSISQPEAAIVVLLYLLVHGDVLLLRVDHARPHCVKITHTLHEVGPLLCGRFGLLEKSCRRGRELGDRPLLGAGIVHQETPVDVVSVDELVGEAAEEVLALRPRQPRRIVRAGVVEAPVDLLLGQARPADAQHAPAVVVSAVTGRPCAFDQRVLAGLGPVGIVVAVENVVAFGHPYQLVLAALDHKFPAA